MVSVWKYLASVYNYLEGLFCKNLSGRKIGLFSKENFLVCLRGDVNGDWSRTNRVDQTGLVDKVSQVRKA